MKHDDLANERVAEVWHRVAQVISIAAAISGLGIFATAAIGAAWHQWAVGQHKGRVAEMREGK